MARVKRGFKLRRRHKKILALAKGYRGSRSTLYRSAVRVVRRGLLFAYRDRRVKKREFRALWIQRINAASRAHGAPYSRVIAALKNSKIVIDRKMLSGLAVYHPEAFQAVLKTANVI